MDPRIEVAARLEYRALKAGTAHHEAARFFEKLDLWWLSTPALVAALAASLLSVAVLTSDDPSTELRAAAVIATALTAAATGVRNSIRSQERAERHQHAGLTYLGVRRSAELVVAAWDAQALDPEVVSARLDDLRRSYDTAGENVPIVPRRIRDRVEKEMEPKRPAIARERSE